MFGNISLNTSPLQFFLNNVDFKVILLYPFNLSFTNIDSKSRGIVNCSMISSFSILKKKKEKKKGLNLCYLVLVKDSEFLLNVSDACHEFVEGLYIL